MKRMMTLLLGLSLVAYGAQAQTSATLNTEKSPLKISYGCPWPGGSSSHSTPGKLVCTRWEPLIRADNSLMEIIDAECGHPSFWHKPKITAEVVGPNKLRIDWYCKAR